MADYDATGAPQLKSDVKSAAARKKGNFSFKRDECFEALLHYNEALSYAESNEMKALAYGNRSIK